MLDWSDPVFQGEPMEAAAAANQMVQAGRGGTMVERIGLEYLELSGTRVVARIPVEPNTQP
ncbi:MAG TPA: esterase, partial [Actinomycetota bacterium]